MPLHLTKVAFGAASLAALEARVAARAAEGSLALTTRYLPRRHDEIAGAGSLYWIVRHQLVARSPILGFGEAEDGRVAIRLDPVLRPVLPVARRAHQGWRYLEAEDAPADLAAGATAAVLPAGLAARLAALALI